MFFNVFRRNTVPLLHRTAKMACVQSAQYSRLQRRPCIHSATIVHKAYYSSNISTHGSIIPEEVRNMSIETYHSISDEFLEDLLVQLEDLSDSFPNIMPDVELSQGVMTFEIPSVGTYVVNKQPPNKQIWLASPVSGPNRFDYIDKNWVSLRDGTTLLDVLNTELRESFPDADVNLSL